MALRTDATSVGAIVEVDEGDDVTPFMTASNELVTELCSGSGYTLTRLTLIETWLSAHFYCIEKPRARMEGAGKVQAVYDSKVEVGLSVTRYGQMAMQLDTAGNLAAQNNAMMKVVKPLAAGTPLTVTWFGSCRPYRTCPVVP